MKVNAERHWRYLRVTQPLEVTGVLHMTLTSGLGSSLVSDTVLMQSGLKVVEESPANS